MGWLQLLLFHSWLAWPSALSCPWIELLTTSVTHCCTLLRKDVPHFSQHQSTKHWLVVMPQRVYFHRRVIPSTLLHGPLLTCLADIIGTVYIPVLTKINFTLWSEFGGTQVKGSRTAILNVSVLLNIWCSAIKQTRSYFNLQCSSLPITFSWIFLRFCVFCKKSGCSKIQHDFQKLLNIKEGWQRQGRAASQDGYLHKTAYDHKVGIQLKSNTLEMT